jgi:hypothetical protein
MCDPEDNEAGWEVDEKDHGNLHVDDAAAEEAAFNLQTQVHTYAFAPIREDALAAFTDVTNILKPPRKGHGYKSAGLDNTIWKRLKGVRMFLGAYICLKTDRPRF